MQSDKELLMLAAKAAGLPALDFDDELGFVGFWIDPPSSMPEEGPLFMIWNPLTDDGDCARLESTCDIDVRWCGGDVRTSVRTADEWPWLTTERFADYGGDKNKARRYASTRAAAQLAQAAQEGK